MGPESGGSPEAISSDDRSNLERILAALKVREAYSQESATASWDEGPQAVHFIELKKDEEEYVRKFLNFQKELPEGTSPSYVLVPSTSLIIDRDRFQQRIESAVALGAKYQDAKIIFAGKMPAAERRTGQEREPEAQLMADEAIEEGLSAERIIIEADSGHLKENIEFFLRDHAEELEQSSETVRVVIAAAQTMLRRCKYCAELLLEQDYPGLKNKVEFYYLPAGDDLNDPDNNRLKYYDEEGEQVDTGGYFSFYEARRLLEYRKKGWL